GWQEVLGVRVTRVVDDAGRPGSSGVARDQALASWPFGIPVFVNPRVAMRWDFDGNPIPPSWQANPRVVPVPLRVATPGARTLRRLEGVVVGEVTVPNQQLLVLDDPLRHPGTAAEAPGGLKLTVLEVKEPAADG